MSFVDFLSDAFNTYNKISNVVDSVRSVLADDVVQKSRVQTTNSQISATRAVEQIVKPVSDTKTASVEASVDRGVRLQLEASTQNNIPILYGRSTLGGKIFDAALKQDTNELQIAMAISMRTGVDIAGNSTLYSLRNVYLDDQRINFDSDGDIAVSVTDTEGNVNTDFAGKIAVDVFAGSANQIPEATVSNPVLRDARNIMVNWGPTHYLQDVVFAIVRIIYEPDLGLDRVPDMTFDIESSLKLPGDVLYDYMTNPLYGAAINENSIKVTSL